MRFSKLCIIGSSEEVKSYTVYVCLGKIFPASKSHKGEPLLLFKALPLRVRVTADVCAAGLFEETPDDIQLFGGVVSISAFML